MPKKTLKKVIRYLLESEACLCRQARYPKLVLLQKVCVCWGGGLLLTVASIYLNFKSMLWPNAFSVLFCVVHDGFGACRQKMFVGLT